MIVSYSNGGAFCYEQICKAAEEVLAKPEAERSADDVALLRGYLAICGAMFDSAPAALSAHAGASALSSAFEPGFTRNAAYWAARGIHGTIGALGDIGVIPHRGREYWTWMDDRKQPYPLAFAYSRTDEITEHAPLAALVAHKRAMGCQVFEHALDRSPHVSHLLTDPIGYKALTTAFMRAATSYAARVARVPRL